VLTFKFMNVSEFDVTFDVSKGADGRNFEFGGWSPLASCPALVPGEKLRQCTELPKLAALTESGYRQVLAGNPRCAHDDMVTFIGRVVRRERLCVRSPHALKGFARYYTGSCGKRSFYTLVQDLHDAASQTVRCGGGWITPCGQDPSVSLVQTHSRDTSAADLGETASLNEKGFRAVAATNNSRKMEAFVRRVLDQQDLWATSQADLEGFIPFYTDECGRQSLDGMVAELHSVAMKLSCACGGSWLEVV